MIPGESSKFFILYPIYFNKNKTRAEGRRVSKEASFDSTMKTIRNLLKQIPSCKFKEEPLKKHPQDQETQGRFKVFSDNRKDIINKLLSIKNGNTAVLQREIKAKVVNNKLKLVPRKKKRSKK